MKNILVGLPCLFLIACLVWNTFYLFEEEDFYEPPQIIKFIGVVEGILLIIGILLGLSWAMGSLILE